MSEINKMIYDSMNLKNTDELVDIWVTNDRVQWSEAAFDAIREILSHRLAELPAQNAPIVKYEERAEELEYSIAEDLVDKNAPPEFYDPGEVIKSARWSKKLAVAAMVVTIVSNIPGLFNFQRFFILYFPHHPQGALIAWLLTLVVGGAIIAVTCYVLYFMLRSLAFILLILMEIEFNSRPTK